MKITKCPFCDYSDKNVIVFSDEFCYAIISKAPINKHHILIIPKDHYINFVELPNRVVSHIFLVAKKLSIALRKSVKPDAIEYISDDDVTKMGLNLVEHYKLHIIPRFKKDRVVIKWNRLPDPGEKIRAKYANDIKKYLR